jgi:hypothetical protein
MIRRGTVDQVMKYQIEYYFGDKNYYKDSFLQAFKTDGNPEGFVPVVELLRFSKMKVNNVFLYHPFYCKMEFDTVAENIPIFTHCRIGTTYSQCTI